MDRLTSTLTVFAMMLLAVGISLKKTLEMDEVALPLLTIEVLLAVALIAGGVMLVTRRYPRRTIRARSALVHPLRRLFSAVWS
jgi:nitrate reductase gamma subunit